jgi:DNA-binding NarL/FixJ family response regulator
VGINVLIADQERTFADALAARLETEDDVAVVAAMQPRAPGRGLIAARQADVIVLDADLADSAASRLCEELTCRDQPPTVIMLSRSSEPERIIDAVRAGAVGWVRKDQSLEYLLQVVRGAAQGETWLPPAETGSVLRLLLNAHEQRQESDRLLDALTPRERQVLACLAEGAGRRDVAQQLHLSANTVRTHLQNLLAKLGVHSTLEAVALTRERMTGHLPGSNPYSRHTLFTDRWPSDESRASPRS